MRATPLPNGLITVERTPTERTAAFAPSPDRVRDLLGVSRTAECLTCDATFTVRPNHPMIEAAHCDACLAILRPLWWDMVHAEMQPPGETMLAMTAEEV